VLGIIGAAGPFVSAWLLYQLMLRIQIWYPNQLLIFGACLLVCALASGLAIALGFTMRARIPASAKQPAGLRAGTIGPTLGTLAIGSLLWGLALIWWIMHPGL
jgi:hypothetical protein